MKSGQVNSGGEHWLVSPVWYWSYHDEHVSKKNFDDRDDAWQVLRFEVPPRGIDKRLVPD